MWFKLNNVAQFVIEDLSVCYDICFWMPKICTLKIERCLVSIWFGYLVYMFSLFQTTLTQHDAGLYEVQYALKYYKYLLFTCNNVVLLYNSNFSLFVSCWHELYLLFHSWEKNINPARSDPRRTLTMLICFL